MSDTRGRPHTIYVFGFNEKLPWEYEVVMMILSQAPGGPPSGSAESTTRKAVTSGFVNGIIELWVKAFGEEYIQSRKVVKNKIVKLLESYYRDVTTARTSGSKAKVCNRGKSERQIKKEWRESHNELFCILKIPCKCKCNCNCKYKDFAHDEKLFYENQKSPGRVGYISDKVDEEYEQSKVQERRVVENPYDDYSTVNADEGQDNESTDPTVSYPSDTPNTSFHEEDIYVNRSGHMRLTSPLQVTTTPTSTRPEIRIGKRKLKEEAKSACARIAIGCGVSTKKARKALKIGCEELYGHKFYLSKEEQRTNEPSIINEETDSVIDKPSKWDDCSYVLPSEHIINDYISLLAAQEEADAGVALHEIPSGTTATLHYDATTRNYIDGDWVSVLLRFSDKRIFDLRPIKLAYEDRDNIINFLEECYIRIATAASVKTGSEITPQQLWENTTFLCTDAVTKNHFIGEGISKRFNSNHVPIHVLCKSHTVEGIDKAVLKVLSQYIEEPLKFRNEFEKYNHALRSFFRHSTVVQAGMKALLKLVTPDKSANSCSLAEDFTQLCLTHGTEQKIVLYHERRFCKLGSCASVLLQALPMLELLLTDIPVDNLLAQACRLYLNCEVFITELRFLAYFNQEVTFPFLNCVEVSDTPTLKRILPKLHQDLLNDDVTTLAEYKVKKSRYLQVDLHGEFELKILHLMCVSVAACIQLQCGREYGFPSNDDAQTKSRAADLTTISDDILADAPTENLITERRLSVFSRRSDTAKYSNKRHTGEMLRDNMVLHAADKKKLDECCKEIKEVLLSLNKDWNEKQHELQVKRLESKYAKKRSHVDYVKKLTASCKSWGGPCCSRQEVLNTIRSHPDMDKTIIRTELSFYIHTHKADRVARPELFRLNGITMEEQLENLCVLLSDDGDYASISSVAEISLPTNSDALHKLETPEANYPVYNINAPVVNMWYENGIIKWYIGYFRKRISESVFEVEQLIRKESDQDLYWLYPQNLLTENIDTEQIMMTDNGKRFPVEGEWDLMGRANKFTLKNLDAIKKQFEKTAF